MLAVVPFGARPAQKKAAGPDEASTGGTLPPGRPSLDELNGAAARQIARRVVQRFETSGVLAAKPVFLVALSEESGVLVFGSTPDAALAAEYARGVDATHALFGILEGDALRTTLVRASDASEVGRFDVSVADRALPEAEGALAIAVARALGVSLSDEQLGSLGMAPTADADAYRAFLLGLEAEVASTILARDKPEQSLESAQRAVAGHLAALRADPAFADAEERLLYLAAERVGRGDREAAMSLLEDVVTASPRSWRAHYMLGELRREAGLDAQAAVAFEFADALHPLSDADQLKLARIYVDTDAPESAAARLRRIRRASPQYGAAQHELGAIAMRRGEHAAAAELLERARGAGEGGEDLLVRLGQSYAALGEAAKARAAFEDALALPDRGWRAPAAYAAFLHEQADLSRAIELYRDAIARGAPPATRLNLARALVVAARRDEARDELGALLEKPADLETAALGRRLLFGLEHPDEERRLEAAGQTAVGAREGDIAAARDTLTDLVRAYPDLWEAHFGLGIAARRLGDAAQAEPSLRRALELWPRQPDALHEFGVALLLQGRVDEAAHRLDDAVAERPDDPGFLADAGFAYLVAGNFVAARARLERARKLDPEDEIAKRYLEELEKREHSADHP